MADSCQIARKPSTMRGDRPSLTAGHSTRTVRACSPDTSRVGLPEPTCATGCGTGRVGTLRHTRPLPGIDTAVLRACRPIRRVPAGPTARRRGGPQRGSPRRTSRLAKGAIPFGRLAARRARPWRRIVRRARRESECEQRRGRLRAARPSRDTARSSNNCALTVLGPDLLDRMRVYREQRPLGRVVRALPRSRGYRTAMQPRQDVDSPCVAPAPSRHWPRSGEPMRHATVRTDSGIHRVLLSCACVEKLRSWCA